MGDKHTPTPWKVFNKNGVISVMTLDHKEVVHWMGFDSSDFPPAVVANAALIVRAVNCHEELVEALKLAQMTVVFLRNNLVADPEHDVSLAADAELQLRKIDAVLAKVEASDA